MVDPESASEPKPYEPLNPNHPRLAIKHGQAFLLTDLEGMMPEAVRQGFGFYHHDTRWLKRWQITLDGKAPLLLNGDAGAAYAATFIYSNDSGLLPPQSLMITRDLVITNGLTERLTIENFSDQQVSLDLSFKFRR